MNRTERAFAATSSATPRARSLVRTVTTKGAVQMNGAYRNQQVKSALRGGSWGDMAKLMRLVPLTAFDRAAIARDLRPVLFLTAPLAELREDRAGR